jgi:phosphatidylserine decarboxylase
MFAEALLIGLTLSVVVLVPLSIKWEIQRTVAIPAAIIIGLVCGSVTAGVQVVSNIGYLILIPVQIFLTIFMAGTLLLWRFFRDPERVPPGVDNVIVSPADGKVIYVRTTEDGNIPYSEKNGKRFPLKDFVRSDVLSQRGTLIGISMNFLDVHVNRAPMKGKIHLLAHIKGLFLSLRKKEAIVENERVLTVIDNGNFKIGIVQIASRLVRKIVPYVNEGNAVQKGERIGMIRFGSQVDLYLPDACGIKIITSPGERVTAGITVMATVDKG